MQRSFNAKGHTALIELKEARLAVAAISNTSLAGLSSTHACLSRSVMLLPMKVRRQPYFLGFLGPGIGRGHECPCHECPCEALSQLPGNLLALLSHQSGPCVCFLYRIKMRACAAARRLPGIEQTACCFWKLVEDSRVDHMQSCDQDRRTWQSDNVAHQPHGRFSDSSWQREKHQPYTWRRSLCCW